MTNHLNKKLASSRVTDWNARHRVGTTVEFRILETGSWKRSQTGCEAFIRNGMAVIHVTGWPDTDVLLSRVRVP